MHAVPPPLRLSELLASLSLATDLGTGQPLGHGLSTCLLSVDLARAMGCDPDEIHTVHQVALLRFVGCTADAAESAAQVGGDDVALLAAMAPVFQGGAAESTRAFVAAIAPGAPALRRARMIATALTDTRATRRSLAAHCEVAAMLGRRLGLGDAVIESLSHAFERWDGKGYPSRLAGSDIPLPIRITQVARDVDLFHRSGIDPMRRIASRRGKAYDPAVVEAVSGLQPREADWAEVLAAEPPPVAEIEDLDAGLRVVADFVDVKSPWTRGHSAAVSSLAEATVRAMGMGEGECRTMRWAGLVHDVGRAGIENGIWDKPGPLATDEWEKVRLHPYHTARVLARCSALAPVAELASSHHERLDGSGYHRGVGRDQLSLAVRVLAAADAFAALTAARPHRAASTIDEAATVLEAEAVAGRFDGEAVGWVVASARGGDAVPMVTNPGGLTDREVEVLTLIASGRTNKQTAERLSISTKTVGRHVENIYAKIGVSTRAGAAVYAMEHRLLG